MESLASYGASAARPPGAGAPAVMQMPKHLRDELEIQQLCDLYQSQLAELNAAHSLLTVDQERLATMLAPYVNASGELVMDAPDPDVMLFKQGLDLRLKEFEEDCKRIQQTEQRLQDKIDSAATDYEQAIHGMATATDSRIFKRLREQQRQIEMQQQEIDQIRFEKELLQEETKRLREISQQDARSQRLHDVRRDLRGFPKLHQAFETTEHAQPLPGTRDEVRFASRRR
eukprot:gb/GFBE01031525.1/.p1 GENE.gb/GFBE01031525.1/~~gb/GFBE01031525.1/.p1  ORF type:complete len:229 (+),score=54.55 gb/GFBE01031525.1/:1-687(+)